MITNRLEDYIEEIYLAKCEKREIKAIDIANKFGLSRPTISEALIKLADLDLIVYKGRKGIAITNKGIIEARKIIKKHKVLYNFFHKILKIDKKTANDNACRIEHVIDDIVIKKIEQIKEQ